MIPALLDRAIVEVLADTTSLGTGFLVSQDGLVLTARHVVGVRDRINVRFGAAAPVAATLVEADPGDWALFRVTARLAGVDPMPRGLVNDVATDVLWYTAGHANIRSGQRGGFHGVVRRVDPAGYLELFCQELVERSYDDARGLSGAPCIVDGEAVGLIVEVTYKNNQIVTGEARAIALDRIKPTRAALGAAGGPRLPWEEVFTAPLQRATAAERQIAAFAANLPNPIEGPRLPQQIARRMINQGVLVVAEVLRQLSELHPQLDYVESLISAAETLWVSGSAAESLANVMEKKATGHLETELDWSARHHLRRAFASRERGPRAWDHVVVSADARAEPFADAVSEATYQELAKALKAPDRISVKRRVYAGRNVTAFVASPPRADVVERLKKDFPGLLIVFMSRVQSSAPARWALESVAPTATEQDEQNAEIQNSDARARLP